MSPQDADLHECQQKERIARVEKFLTGNGTDGVVQKITRLEVKVTQILGTNRVIMLTGLGIIGKLLYDHFTMAH